MPQSDGGGFRQPLWRRCSEGLKRRLAPTPSVMPETVEVMSELNVDISCHVPRRYDLLTIDNYDLVVNMAGFRLPGPAPKELIEWQIRILINSRWMSTAPSGAIWNSG